MNERRELLRKISNQLKTMSDFVDGVERSMYVQVQIKHLEPQFRHILEGIKQTFEAVSEIHQESLVVLSKDTEEMDNLKKELREQSERVLELEEQNLNLRSPKKRSRKKRD